MAGGRRLALLAAAVALLADAEPQLLGPGRPAGASPESSPPAEFLLRRGPTTTGWGGGGEDADRGDGAAVDESPSRQRSTRAFTDGPMLEAPQTAALALRGAPQAPADERPGRGFPGATAAQSHAAWPSGRQPARLEAWPRQPSGLPGSCWKKARVLQDINLGWPGACQSLMRTSAINALDCHESCARNPLCSVWRYNLMTQCTQGIGDHCGDVSGSDLLTMGSQRLLHGDVEVLMDLKGWEIRGLRSVGDTSWGSGNDTFGLENCRAWCYSNLHCQYWQYGSGRCLAEDRGRYVTYPLTTSKDGDARFNTSHARSLLGGEYIQHVCRPVTSGRAVAAGADGQMMPMQIQDADSEPAAFVQWAWAMAFAVVTAAVGYQVWSVLKLHRFYQSSSRRSSLESLVEGMESQGSDSDPQSPKEQQACEACDKRQVRQGWHRFPLVPLHTFLQPGHVDGLVRDGFATPAERRAVRKISPDGPQTLADFLAWRRLCIGTLIAVGFVYYVMQCCVLASTKRLGQHFDQLALRPELANYQKFISAGTAQFSFLEYSQQKLLTLLSGVLAEVLRGACCVEVVVCVMELLPLVFLGMALFNWTSFARSRHYVLCAWFFAFLTPFFVSLFPMRLIVSFSETELEVDRYIHELAVALHLDKAQELLLGGCDQVLNQKFDEKIERVGKTLHTTCSSLSIFPAKLAVPCLDSLSLCHVDLSEAADGCHEAMSQFDMGHVEAASGIVKSECSKIQQAFVAGQGSAEERERGRLRAFRALLDMMRMPFHTLVPSIEVVSISISALHAFFMVIPPFTGIAPGFVCAGIATKGLAPFSELPGAVIMIVPIVMASVMWVISTVLFQYVSHGWTLCLLVVIISFPLSLVVVSSLHQFTKPTPREVLSRGIRALHASSGAFTFVIFVMAWKIFEDAVGRTSAIPGLVQLMEWCEVGWGRLTLSCFLHLLYSFMLTSFGATDWMISDISAQQRYWTYWLDKEIETKEPAKAARNRKIRLLSRSMTGGTPDTPYRCSVHAVQFFPEREEDASTKEEGPEELKNRDLCELLRHQLVVAELAEELECRAPSP